MIVEVTLRDPVAALEKGYLLPDSFLLGRKYKPKVVAIVKEINWRAALMDMEYFAEFALTPMVFTVGQVEPPSPSPLPSPLPSFYTPHMPEQHNLLREMISNNQRPAQRRSVDLAGGDQIFFKDRKALLVHMWLFQGGLDNCFVLEEHGIAFSELKKMDHIGEHICPLGQFWRKPPSLGQIMFVLFRALQSDTCANSELGTLCSQGHWERIWTTAQMSR